ncbi:hydroxymethylbilane synthase [Gordonibacter sp. 28C]|uniref:hydroxymethylbilane synthase n=1 Tax=Gordonibacter sp. 28C TaxID=2078569 RepID=UPI000DF7FBB3|nr:hydroxymethylbilane synthase [Gordonibacter sp. 28C]RDB61492.1 hydroxymethylbilane synthase [Gordonibacter sp. 28C]
MKRLVIGTRKSELALWQSEWVRARLIEAHPGLEVELAETDTAGDRDLATPLPLVDGKGVFTAEIENGLRDGSIDLAVHSLKDLPTVLPDGFEIGAYCMRHDPRDAFLGKDGLTLADLPEGARIGTSSLRRAAQVHRVRPDVECANIRGNLATRWRKLQEDEGMAGIILAVAGVARLGWRDRITEYLAPDTVMPAAGQGVIAVEVASGRDDVAALVQAVNHAESERAARAERSFLAALEGGCQTPIGALAVCTGDVVRLAGMVCSLDGSRMVRVERTGADPESVGRDAAEDAFAQGAADILPANADRAGV